MREHGTRNNGILTFQSAYQLVHIFFRIEAKAVHAGIELNVYRIIRYSFTLCGLDKSVEQTETIHLRLEVVVEHRLECRHLRIHDHDVACYSVFTQRYALIGNSHCEIVYTMVLKGFCHFHGSGAIGVCLYHSNELRLRFHERAVIVEIVNESTKIYLKDCLVYFLFEQFADIIEAE